MHFVYRCALHTVVGCVIHFAHMEDEVSVKRSFAKTAKLAVAFAIVLVIGFAGGVTAARSGNNPFADAFSFFGGLSAEPAADADLADFWRAWNALETKFVETHGSSTLPTARDRVLGAIKGLAESYGDPYTVFMPPEEAKQFEDDISGNFEGVGMELGISDSGMLTVIAPLKGTPAERAGLVPGDELFAIDGKATDGMTTDEAVKLIRGPKGSTVVFTIIRDGATSDISVVRDVINIPTIETKYDAATGIFTISFYSFTAIASTQFDAALAEMRNTGATSLIIDLRGNPGGYLDTAVRVASRFLPDGSVVVTEDYKGNRENLVHRSSGSGGVSNDIKVVVLIDKGSASASEILGGALQDAGRATLIGTKSFGKGSVQELMDLGGGALKVTVARWLTPSGRSISDGGLTPDILVERTLEEAQSGKDPQMDRAVQFLTTGK